MQCYRLRTFLCDTADMTHNTISIFFPIRMGIHFIPLHSPDSADFGLFAYFFHAKPGPALRKRRGIYPERLTGTFMVPRASYAIVPS